MEVTMNKLLAGVAVLPFLGSGVWAALPNPPPGPPPVPCPKYFEYVLGTDHNLWREHNDEPTDWNVKNRVWIDRDVAQFQAMFCTNVVYVLDTDGSLWREPRLQRGPKPIDQNVAQFQVVDNNTAYALHTDGSLWSEYTDNRPYPPPFPVDDRVVQFQGINSNLVYVLEAGGKLWHVGDALYLVDQNVLDFQVDTHGNVYVLYTDRNLYRKYTNGKRPDWVDGNVLAFQALDETYVYVLGTDGKLWRERGNMNNRDSVAQGVLGFQVLDPARVDILWADRELRNNLASADIDANVLEFQNGQGPFKAVGLTTWDSSSCPYEYKAAPQSPPVSATPPCIDSITQGIDYGTSVGVHLTPDAFYKHCDPGGDRGLPPGKPCYWDVLTDYDQYQVRWALGVDSSTWHDQITLGTDTHGDVSLNQLQPGVFYGVIAEGKISGEWTRWSDCIIVIPGPDPMMVTPGQC
jgi:hypothetical protein